jgi:DNA-binding winged helix-turn-helix (wHTH) protein
MNTNAYPEPVLWRKSPLPHHVTWSSSGRADAAIEFGHFRVLLRRRWLLADGVPVELGTRAFDLLLVLLEADGALVTKQELLNRVWPGIVVSEENLKVQISALRKALGADRGLIHTEFGRGYRFTGMVRSNATVNACRDPRRAKLRSARLYSHRTTGYRSSESQVVLVAETCTSTTKGVRNPLPAHTVQPCQTDFLQEQAMTLIPSSTIDAPPRSVAGVTIPDSKTGT